MININSIMSVYSGRPGCACGCRGKHTYKPELKEVAGENRGYPVHDDECSSRTVKMIVNKMNTLNPNLEQEHNHYSIELPNRLYIAYVKPELVIGI
jgi:hypothetical protein